MKAALSTASLEIACNRGAGILAITDLANQTGAVL